MIITRINIHINKSKFLNKFLYKANIGSNFTIQLTNSNNKCLPKFTENKRILSHDDA